MNDDGFAVDIHERIVHRRYADHAKGFPRTRSLSGVVAYFGVHFSNCPECWPPVKPTRKKVPR